MRKLKWSLVLGALAAVLVVGTALALQNQPSPAAAKKEAACSYAGVAGDWGHSLTGTIYPPTAPGSVPMATAGRTVFKADGTISGTQTGSVNGVVADEVIRGTWTVNPDCTGMMTVDILDQQGNVSRTAIWAMVYVDNQTESRGIIKSLVRVTASGPVNVPAIVTQNAKKLFPVTEDMQ